MGRHSPLRRHPWADTPRADTSPQRRPLQRIVLILLEYILVYKGRCDMCLWFCTCWMTKIFIIYTLWFDVHLWYCTCWMTKLFIIYTRSCDMCLWCCTCWMTKLFTVYFYRGWQDQSHKLWSNRSSFGTEDLDDCSHQTLLGKDVGRAPQNLVVRHLLEGPRRTISITTKELRFFVKWTVHPLRQGYYVILVPCRKSTPF